VNVPQALEESKLYHRPTDKSIDLEHLEHFKEELVPEVDSVLLFLLLALQFSIAVLRSLATGRGEQIGLV